MVVAEPAERRVLAWLAQPGHQYRVLSVELVELVEPATIRALTRAKQVVQAVPSRRYLTCLLLHCLGYSSCTHPQVLHIAVVLVAEAEAEAIQVTADQEVAVVVS